MLCPLIHWHDLSESEKSDFEGMEDDQFFHFGAFTFALSEFTRAGDCGIYNFNAFHGVKITISPDGDAVNAKSRGIYIPRDFAEGFDLKSWHIDFDVSALSDPESELYWDTWERVLNNAYLIEGEYRFTLWQDGDLWAICPELMTELEKLHFFGEV